MIVKMLAGDYAGDGFSHMYHHLLSRGSKGIKISEAKLAQYGENIKRHLRRGISRNRKGPIPLRYF